MAETLERPATVTAAASAAAASALRGKAPVLTHCVDMLDRFGMVQFARGEERDLASGYCADDNARALLTAVNALLLDPSNADARRIGESALAFVELAHDPRVGFHNLMDENGTFVEGGDSPDAVGRTIWALGTTVRRTRDEGWRARAADMLEIAWPAALELAELRPRAYALLGAAASAARLPRAREVVEIIAPDLLEQFEASATDDWAWWEPRLTWGNARIPHAMLRAALITGHEPYRTCGLRALEFLGSVTQPDDMFMPIGNNGWYERGGNRAIYDQQPIEANAMVDAWLAAADLTGERAYRRQALHAFYWFFGLNSEGMMVARPQTGGCHDGLERGRVNPNMGAESTLSYLLSHLAIARDELGLAP